MAKKKRWEIEDLAEPTPEEKVLALEPEAEPKVHFEHWVAGVVKEGRLKFYQDEALLVFFRKQGLKNQETEETYNKMFERF